MADANLKIPSEERIRFNASESIINAVSPRVDISAIPGGHRMVVTDIDGVETADIMDGVKGDTGAAAGFGTVSASVDANVGTPSVTVTSSGPNTAKNFDISFKNLKGNTGDAAGFGTVSASVDANVGTPSVTVTSSGPNTAKNFDISFKNLKGVKGDTGAAAGFDTPTASVDGYIGTPSVAVTATGPATAKKFDFAFHNLKGEKGDTGSIESLIVDGTEPEEGAGVSVDGPISELSAEGWATQFSTSGKNLAKSYGDAHTENGFTFETISQSEVKVYGTGTAETGTTWTYPVDGTYISLQPGTYTYSIAIDGSGDTDAIYGRLRKDSLYGVVLDIHSYNGYRDSSRTFTVSTESKFYVTVGVLGSQVYGSYPTVNATVRIQLELGSTATEYEPYTGGAPSPSPDYPQEIEVAKGRNLAHEYVLQTGRQDTIYGTVIATETGFRYIAGKSSNANGVFIDKMLYANNYYVLTYDSNSAIINVRLYVDKAATEQLNTVLVSGSPFKPDKNCYVRFWVQGASVVDATRIQLTLGSTPQPYVPYGYVGMEVQGKNLWGGDRMAADIVSANLNSTIETDSNGRYVTLPASSINGKTLFSGPFKDGTQYTIRLKWSKSNNTMSGNAQIVYSDGSKTYISNPSSSYVENTVTTFVVVSAPGKTISLIQGVNHSALVKWYYDECGLFEGVHTVDEYEPYHHTTTPIPLPSRGWVCSLPDGTADILHLDGAGKVEWELETEEIVFDGSSDESYVMENNGNRVRTGPKSYIKYPPNDYTIQQALFSHFRAVKPYDTWIGRIGASINNGAGTIGFADGTGSMTVAAWKTWLQSNPVTVLYPLATPQTESLGYIDLPDIPAGSTVSIPELDALGISYYVDNGAVRKLAEQYKARLEATSFADIEDAVTELATEVHENTNRTQLYFGYDTVNGKQMISVFKRNV